MPEPISGAQVCPYLRGRRQASPVLMPSDDNHCVLAASIHLPHAQQSRFCLGGRYAACSRYKRQRDRPLPKYVVGVRPAPAPPPVQAPERPTLLWRRSWFRPALLWGLAVVFALLVIMAWRWQEQRTQPRITPRPPLPTIIALPTAEAPTIFDPPSVRPVENSD
ncbi:MAG TPA: hypothetical protein G4N94_10255 [Caldilineae bacterium]|nr:hypothetical protein [Caldilineae bacterium]